MNRALHAVAALAIALGIVGAAQAQPASNPGPNVPETNPATTPRSPPVTQTAPPPPPSLPNSSAPPNSGVSNPYIGAPPAGGAPER